MSGVSASIGAPRVPQANLLPPEVFARRGQTRTKALLAFGLVVFVAAVAAAVVATTLLRVAAEDELEALREERAERAAELASFDTVPEIERTVDNALMARTWVGYSDVLWADYIAQLVAALPNDVVFDDVTVAASSPLALTNPSNSPFVTSHVGTLAFTAHAERPILAADLMNAVDAIEGFHETHLEIDEIETFDGDDQMVTYWIIRGTTTVTESALSGRVNPFNDPVVLDTTVEGADQ